MRKCALYILVAITRFLSWFPLKVHYFWADFIAWVLRSVAGYRRDVVAVNLGRSFPNADCDLVKSYSKRFYTHLAEIFTEMIWFSGSNPARLKKSGILTVRNAKVLENAYKSAPSVIVLYSHCGNWELLGGLPYCRCEDMDEFPIPVDSFRCVYKALTNKVSDEFFRKSRLAMNPEKDVLLESKHLLRYMINHINASDPLVYILGIDQSPYVSYVDIGSFMHQPTKAFLAPAEIAHKFGSAVLYMNYERVGRGHYEISFEEICADGREMSAFDIIRSYYDKLEAEINRHPDNWLWSHKRWK